MLTLSQIRLVRLMDGGWKLDLLSYFGGLNSCLEYRELAFLFMTSLLTTKFTSHSERSRSCLAVASLLLITAR